MCVYDIPNDSDNPYLMFADDIELLGTANSEALQKDVDVVYQWSVRLELLLNSSKCKQPIKGDANPFAT